MKQNSFRLFLGLFAEAYIHPAPATTDSVSFSEDLQHGVFVEIKEVVRMSERFDLYYAISDVTATEEEFSARAKGPIKTLFISDERYFKNKNA